MLKKLSLIATALAFAFAASSGEASAKDWTYFQKVRIVSTPSGANVTFDGKNLGTTPCEAELPVIVDKHTMRATSNTKPWELTFTKDGYTEEATYDPFTLESDGRGFRHKLLVNHTMTSIPKETAPVAQNVVTGGRVTRDNPGGSDLENVIIRWAIDSEPRGARVYWRVVSNCPQEVKNTNETYLMTTPYEETRAFNILGLTYDNSTNVQIEIKLEKSGYETQVKRFNVRQAIDQQEISSFFELVPKAGQRQPQYYQQPQYQQPQQPYYQQPQYQQPQQQYPQYQQPQQQYQQPQQYGQPQYNQQPQPQQAQPQYPQGQPQQPYGQPQQQYPQGQPNQYYRY